MGKNLEREMFRKHCTTLCVRMEDAEVGTFDWAVAPGDQIVCFAGRVHDSDRHRSRANVRVQFSDRERRCHYRHGGGWPSRGTTSICS